METLIILIGAIIILSIAFYMAREKSFVPPEEVMIEQQMSVTEGKIDKSDSEQKEIEDSLAQDSAGTDREITIEQDVSEQDMHAAAPGQERVLEEEPPILSAEQSLPQTGNDTEPQSVSESLGQELASSQEQTYDGIDESSISESVYTVQVGYFSIESNARGLAEEIESHGFQSFLLKHNNAYKVQVGAYQTREQAEKASQQLKNLGYEIWLAMLQNVENVVKLARNYF